MEDKLYYVCKYTPLELLESYGFCPERLDLDSKGEECGESFSYPKLCGYGKAILKAADEGDIKKLFLVDCCDVCRRIYDILSARGNTELLYLMDLPHKNGRPEKKRMKREIMRLNEFLQKTTGRDFDEKRARELWREGIIKARAERPEEEHVVLTGAHGNAGLKERIEEITKLPALDDTCSGNRELREETGEEFFSDYSDALLSQKNPCRRMQFKREKNPRGVGTICHTIKFCDYYGPGYRDYGEADAPLLRIETDWTNQSGGQIETRLEAFTELINPKIIKKKATKKGRYVCGIDSGSSSTNAVILDENKRILGFSIIPTGSGAEKSGRLAFEEALKSAGLNEDDICRVITTGYGRKNLRLSDSSVTEITCHAKGAVFLCPEARTVIDIGGQDSKVILLDENGKVVNFAMNDKCAAGTGRFLETMAKTLDFTLEDMSAAGLKWENPVTISNTCTVFAESEVVSLIAKNTNRADIVNGLNQSIASRIASMVKTAKGRPPYIMTGGVSNNTGVEKALENALGEKIYAPKEAQICGALGAALFALE